MSVPRAIDSQMAELGGFDPAPRRAALLSYTLDEQKYSKRIPELR